MPRLNYNPKLKTKYDLLNETDFSEAIPYVNSENSISGLLDFKIFCEHAP